MSINSFLLAQRKELIWHICFCDCTVTFWKLFKWHTHTNCGGGLVDGRTPTQSSKMQPLKITFMMKCSNAEKDLWYYSKWRTQGAQRQKGKMPRTERCFAKTTRVGSDHFFLFSKWSLKLLCGLLMNDKMKKKGKPFFPLRNPICPRNVL